MRTHGRTKCKKQLESHLTINYIIPLILWDPNLPTISLLFEVCCTSWLKIPRGADSMQIQVKVVEDKVDVILHLGGFTVGWVRLWFSSVLPSFWEYTSVRKTVFPTPCCIWLMFFLTSWFHNWLLHSEETSWCEWSNLLRTKERILY